MLGIADGGGRPFCFASQHTRRKVDDVKDLLIVDQAHLWTLGPWVALSRRSCKRAEPETIASLSTVMGGEEDRQEKKTKKRERERRDWCRAWPAGKLRVRLETGHLYTYTSVQTQILWDDEGRITGGKRRIKRHDNKKELSKRKTPLFF